jgi:AraC-like DNA-binding protein
MPEPVPSQVADTQLLQNLLLRKIIPWVQTRGMANIFVAYPSWKALKKADPNFPDGASVTHKPLHGKRVRGKNQRSHGNMGVEEYRWPKDKLLSARVPKVCFVVEGPVAFQIADYVLHCSPGHGILLPPGTPFPDGTLAVLDQTKMHHSACELLMILPRQVSVNCWTSRQWYEQPGKMLHKSVTCSAPQSQIPNLLYQLINEALQKKLHWERLCGCLLEMLLSLLHRELQPLPVFQGGNISLGGIAEQIPDPIKRVEEYIQNNLQSTAYLSLTIDEMARYAYLSRTAFIRQFRERTGKSFNEYVNDCRYEKACQLLRGSDLAMEPVSQQVGIKTRSLHLLMRQRAGLSPTAFRRKYSSFKND